MFGDVEERDGFLIVLSRRQVMVEGARGAEWKIVQSRTIEV